MDFHQVVQTTDIEAINLVVKDDETCHLFLKCQPYGLDSFIGDVKYLLKKGFNILKKAHATLYVMLENDTKELVGVAKIAT